MLPDGRARQASAASSKVRHDDLSRKEFLLGLGTALFLPSFSVGGGRTPRLRFGVVSDIHISRLSAKPETYAYGNSTTFRSALEYFRDQGVDAVVCPGDMSDRGVTWMLDVCGQVWRQVFPGNRAPDGRKVEPIFVYGNHDSDKRWFDRASGILKDKSAAEAETIKAMSISRCEAAAWEHAFGEPWQPVYLKRVKGYAFVGVHWGHEGELPAFLAAHRDELKGAKPFFEVQHPHPKGTLYGRYTWGEDAGATTKALAGFPNAVSFSGHSHTSIALEASVWQGAFTAIGCSSLSYQSLFERKNVLNVSPKGNRYKAASSSHREGMLVTVYDDCLEIERREFVRGEALGPNWEIPLPVDAEERPFSYAVQKRRLLPPEFPKGARPTVSKTKDYIEIGLPAAMHAPERTRTIWYELTVLDGGKPVYSATLLADGFFAPSGKIPQPTAFKVRPDELPAGGDFRYEVVARDIFDRVSRPLAVDGTP